MRAEVNRMEHELNNVDEMEQEAKFKIITLEDEEDSSSKQYIEDIQRKITILYEEFRNWVKENQESDTYIARKAKLKEESDKLILLAKFQMQKVKENERFQDSLEKGKELVADASEWLVDGVKVVMQQESVRKISSNVEDVVIQVKENERIKEGVKSFKKGTLKLAESAFNGLKKVLDDTQESEIEVQDDEKNNNL